MYSRLGRINYWQLWACLPIDSLIALANYQWGTWGTRLDIITGHDTYRPELEPIDEIDKIMRQRPKPRRIRNL